MGSMTARIAYSVELTKAELRLIGLSLQGLLTRPEDLKEASVLGVRILKDQLHAVDIQREAITNALTVAESKT